MIQSDNLHLWPIERQDLNNNYVWANDMELTRLAGATPLPRSSQDVEQWYRNLRVTPAQHIFAKKTKHGEYLGNIEFRGLDLRCGCAEIGIIIGERKAWGQGLGAEAIRSMCNFGFGELRLHRIYATTLSNNPRAIRLFEKCGFKLEGIKRQAYYQDGQYLDILMWGLLENEFWANNPPEHSDKSMEHSDKSMEHSDKSMEQAQGMIAQGKDLLSNPYTAAAGAAMVEAGEAQLARAHSDSAK